MKNENIGGIYSVCQVFVLSCICLSFRLPQSKLFLFFSELVSALDTQKITLVSCGRAHSMALNDQGQVFAWGAGEGGQLGLGTAEAAVRIPRWSSRTPKKETELKCDRMKQFEEIEDQGVNMTDKRALLFETNSACAQLVGVCLTKSSAAIYSLKFTIPNSSLVFWVYLTIRN